MDPDRLAQLMTFPAPFTFRVVAQGSPDLRAACLAQAEEALGREVEGVDVQTSSGGRYHTVRLTVTVQRPEEVSAVYEALGAVPGLRMLL